MHFCAVWDQIAVFYDYRGLTEEYKVRCGVADEFDERLLHHFRHGKPGTQDIG